MAALTAEVSAFARVFAGMSSHGHSYVDVQRDVLHSQCLLAHIRRPPQRAHANVSHPVFALHQRRLMAWAVERKAGTIELSGELRLADATPIWERLTRLSDEPPRTLDLRQVDAIDGAVIALLVEVRARLAHRDVACEIVGATPGVQRILQLHELGTPAPQPEPELRGVLPVVGAAAERAVVGAGSALAFIGELTAAYARVVTRRSHVTWRALPGLLERTGADAVPIVALLNFLVGFILAYQSSRPLEQFGANIFIADLIGISLTRELAPLVTAAILSGRAGAAFTAELGTMRVTEEIDALRTLGFSPIPHLVIPRVLALAAAAPMLTLLADVAGTLGGVIVAATSLDVSPNAFVAELRIALITSDIWTGLVKSVAFGAAIAIIACQQGLATSGGAEGVGRRTTSTVVTSLLAIVLIDAALTIVFRGFGV